MSQRRQIVVVTGASGFVGNALTASLAADTRYECRACFRTEPHSFLTGVETYVVGDLADRPKLDDALAGADIVVHTAARTHVLNENGSDALSAYRALNVAGTRNLAAASAAAKVGRFVYLSSVKVNGEHTPIDRPFTDADVPAPQDAYGITKWEAECSLWDVAADSGLPSVVIRPPLIYGPGVKGNLRRLERLVARGVPLPLGAIRNRRSMIGLDNLISAILAVMDHPGAVGRTFLVSDADDVSTPDLLEALGDGLRRRPLLFPVPVGLLRILGGLSRRGHEVERLVGSLRVDSAAITQATGWRPLRSAVEGLAAMAAADRDVLN